MSSFLFLKGSNPVCKAYSSLIVKPGKIQTISLLALFMAATTVIPVAAGPLDWLKSKSRPANKSNSRVLVSENNNQQGNSGLSTVPGQQALTGKDLDPMSFAKSHWSHSKERLEKVCRAIIQKSNDNANSDFLKKLFVIDTQVFKEAIKNSAQAVNEISVANEGMRRQLAELSRIITAPGQETLENLEKSVARLKYSNQQQILIVRKYLVGSEKIIEIGNRAYETLELIPSLSVTGTDLTVASSKQLMKIAQSNSEAFKGLLLNVQSSYEQFVSGLDMITRTVKETLRFSDHFAIKQFPLINLPAPSREKIYVQLGTLNNSLKGVSNTLSIGDSQVRNTAQQFTHLVSALSAKVGEALKFSSPAEGSSERAIDQISNYAQNQVAGLYQRVKEDIRQGRAEMAAVLKSGNAQVAPGINIESRTDFVARRASAATKEKLPLFLLGAGGKVITEPQAPEEDLKQFAEEKEQLVAKVLYSEKAPSVSSDLMGHEINILQDELGGNFFFANNEDSAENIAPEMIDGDSEEISTKDYSDEQDNMQVSYDNLESISEPEIELLKFDLSESSQDSSELIPMMRMDEESLMFED